MRKSMMMAAIAITGYLAAPSAADSDNLVPSCYAVTQIGVPAPPARRAIFVLIDQTTPVSAELLQTLRQDAAANALPGTHFVVASFSATEGGQFIRFSGGGTIESGVPGGMRSSLPVPRLSRLDSCLAQQQAFGARKLDQAIGTAARPARATFDHSEIMRSLAQLSSRVSATPAAERIVIVYSDMIEHSDATSFYQAHNLRTIDPGAELAKAASRGLFGNFAGARVYVIGGGLALTGPMRDSRARDALRVFWSGWFARSRAHLVEFGAPNLMNAIR